MFKIVLLSAALIWNIHEWYPKACCDERHCHPIPCDEIQSKGEYYTWRGHSWLKAIAQAAPDGACHVCHDTIGHDYCIFLGGTS